MDKTPPNVAVEIQAMAIREYLSTFSLVLVLTAPLFGRTWTDKNGKKVDAELIAVKGDNVYLEKTDGGLLKVPLTSFSQSDQEYLRSLSAPKKSDDGFGGSPTTATPSSPAPIPAEAAGKVRGFGELSWGVQSLAFSPDGRRLAVGKLDSAVLLYDVQQGHRLNIQDKLESLGQVTAAIFTPDGKKLLTGGYTGKIQVWDVSGDGQLKPSSQFVGHNGEVHAIAVTGDGQRALSGSSDKTAKFWEISSGRELADIVGFKGDVKACFVTPDGGQALAADGETLLHYDLKAKQSARTHRLANAVAQAVAISPDGSFVVASDLYALRLWDTVSGKEFPKLQDREIQWTAAFTADGRLVSGGSGKFNLWDVSTQKRIYSCDVDSGGYVQALTVSSDGEYVAAHGRREIFLFRLPPPE